MRRGLYPLLVTTQAIPPIALATPLAIWLGYGLWPKVIVAALLVFFPVFVNAHAGLTQLEPGLERLLRSLGASRLQVLRVARLPSALPLVLAALRLGATYAVIGAVFGEWVGADDGLGIYLLQANGRLQTDRVLAAVLVLAALGLIAFGLVALAEHALTPWRRRSTRAGAAASQEVKSSGRIASAASARVKRSISPSRSSRSISRRCRSITERPAASVLSKPSISRVLPCARQTASHSGQRSSSSQRSLPSRRQRRG